MHILLRFATYFALAALLVVATRYPATNSDGFYYLTVARNFVEQRHFTFDQIHTTNGFHWAWMAGLVSLAWAARDIFSIPLDSQLFIDLSTALNILVYAAAMAVGAELLTDFGLTWWRRELVVLFAFLEPGMIQKTITGLETALLILGLLTVAYFVRSRQSLLAIVAAHALVLVRIEAVVLLPALAFFYRRSLRDRLWLLCPWSLGVVLLLNYWADGSFVSNAAAAKWYWASQANSRVFSQLELPAQALSVIRSLTRISTSLQWPLQVVFRPTEPVLAVAGLGVSALVSLTLIFCLRSTSRLVTGYLRHPALLILLVYSAVTYIFYKAVYFDPLDSVTSKVVAVFDYQSVWYFAPLGLLVNLAVYALFVGRRRVHTFLSAHFGLLVSLVLFAFLWVVQMQMLQQWSTAARASASSGCWQPDASTLMAAQNDNRLVYDRRVRLIVLDGLVTGRNIESGERYLEVLGSGGLNAYLDRLRVDYIASDVAMSWPEYSTTYSRAVSTIEVCGGGQFLRRQGSGV